MYDKSTLLWKWLKQNIRIEKFKQTVFCKVGDVWWCYIGQNVGHEQNGDSQNFRRPILIIKKFSSNTILIVPLTTSQENHRYRINIPKINNRKSKIILSQMRVIDNKRLDNRICTLHDDIFEKIIKNIRNLF